MKQNRKKANVKKATGYSQRQEYQVRSILFERQTSGGDGGIFHGGMNRSHEGLLIWRKRISSPGNGVRWVLHYRVSLSGAIIQWSYLCL